MTDSVSSERDPSASIWEYIKLKDFAPPAASTQETVRKGLRGLLNRFGLSPRPDEPAVAQDELRRLPEQLYYQVAPEPDWCDPLAALDRVLQSDLTASEPTSPRRVVVGAPYSGSAEVLAHWAKKQGVSPVDLPSPETLLQGNAGWFEHLADTSQNPLVITHLERCYLRHHDGLRPMRHLLDWLSKRQGTYVLGCSSWSWTYLSKALHAATLFSEPWVLQSLDGQRLEQWFTRLAASQGEGRLVFRQSDTGDVIMRFPPASESPAESSRARQNTNSGEDEPQPSRALVDLAAHGRGNPGVALALWRHSLRLAPDKEDSQQDTVESSTTTPNRTVWVKPLSKLVLPTPAETPDRDTLQVLHALLLHDGLSAPLLTELLPVSLFEVMRRLRRLERDGLLTVADERWRVTPLGYPAVRQALFQEGYPVDVL